MEEFLAGHQTDNVGRHCLATAGVQVTRLYQQFTNVPDIGLAYCDSQVIDEKGDPVESYDYRFKYFKNIWDKSFVADGKSLIRDYLIFRNVIPNVSAVLFKKA